MSHCLIVNLLPGKTLAEMEVKSLKSHELYGKREITISTLTKKEEEIEHNFHFKLSKSDFGKYIITVLVILIIILFFSNYLLKLFSKLI